MKYKITDWAGNILDFKGNFKLPQLAVEMEFDSFDDAWDWITEHVPYSQDQFNYYVEEL